MNEALESGDAGPRARVGLVLPGGGARAAYQAGVLKAIAELLPPDHPNPFPVIAGTSAGAINAALIASHAQHFHAGVEHLAGVWENISTDRVFRTDSLTIIKTGLSWLFTLLHAGFGRYNPISLLDNTPLRRLLEDHIVFAHLQQAIDSGALHALAITASGYSSARSISFYKARPGAQPWHRMRRLGQAAELRLDHIMASVALPMIFPAVRIGREYFGDGSMRQSAPLSPAVHLGAERVLVIAVRNEQANRLSDGEQEPDYPSLGQIAGYMLDTLFMDSIYGDLERLQRINDTVSHINERPTSLKVIETLVVVPSEDIRDIAQRHKGEFPRSVRLLLRGVGGLHRSGSQLLSYLLFESGYCRELIALGYRDAMAQSDKLLKFMDPESVSAPEPDRVTG
ncbi:MAG TPA: patatin-like phospholipase family protein [Gammaproteobacteria bacterium]|nr:patatin-like phospholipase family protein [Gammaproteobacteria bacterium]